MPHASWRASTALFLAILTATLALELTGADCPNALLRVPQSPIGTASPYVSGRGSNLTFSGDAGPSQAFCCLSGQVSHWILGKTVGNSFIGSLAANCTDGLALPKIAYGFNGTSDCASGLYNETAVSNEGYKLLGNFSYRSESVLESFLDFQPTDSFFNCGKFLAPIGYAASSSCLGITSFQVICGQPYADASCPVSSVLVPSSPLGSAGPVMLGQDNYSEYTSVASQATTHCCSSGSIQSWTIARTGHLFFGPGQHSSVGNVSAQCTDGTLLPSVVYGFNKTSNCTVLLNQSETVPNPYSNQFFYSAGAFLDGFISFGAPNPPDTPYFACNTSQVAVGYRAASNCLALTTFQVVCGNPNPIHPSLPTGSKSNLSRAQRAGIGLAVSLTALGLITVLIHLLYRGRRKRQKVKERAVEMDGEGQYVILTNLSEIASAELVDIAELRDHNTQAAHLVLKPPYTPNQAESVIRVQLPNQGDTLVFQGEVGDLPVFSNQTSQALQELWQIQPGTLKCKKKANGELFKLGTGGSGSVYLGVLLGTTDVAIKVIDSPSPQDRKRFEREVTLLKACRHPNLIQFLGASVFANQTLLVMEFMYGGDLYDQLRKDAYGTLLWSKRGRSIALDIAKGMIYLHSHNILHLDIKSPNILLNSAGAKISDIGLGRRIAGGSSTTLSYGASLPWCAPEQILHEPCTSATDVYALGSVLWELITGELPTQQRQFRPPKVPQEAPSEIAALFARCHHADPRQRPTAIEAHAIILDSRQYTEMASVCVSHLVRE